MYLTNKNNNMNKNELVVDTRFHLGGAREYSTDDITRSLNYYLKDAQQIALKTSKIWKLNKDVLSTSILNGVSTYATALNTGMLDVNKIEINYTGTTDGYMPCTVIGDRSMETLSNTNNITIDNNVSKYNIILDGNTLTLPQEPTLTVADGIKIYFQSKWQDLRDNTITATVEEDIDKTLTISEISSETDSLLDITVVLQQNTSDVLAVTFATSTLTIKLANTTASKNTVALIQAAIRVLTATGIDFTEAECVGVDWTDILGAVITVGSVDATLVVNNEPELDDTLHRYMSYGAAYDYTVAHDLDDKGKKLIGELAYFKNKIADYYANRLNQGRVRISPLKPRYN